MNYRYRVVLETMRDVADFVNAVSEVDEPVYLISGNLKVSAKSLLGAIYTMEWEEVWCESTTDIYEKIKEFTM